ncbi:MAG TPA: heme-binding protein [Methyloceanibacter sp.]
MTIAQLFDSALSVFGVRTAEEPHYDIVERIGEVEIRRYGPRLAAETIIASGDNTMNEAFFILAGYIFGGNQKKQDIAMTAPVGIERGQDIAMTAPVATEATQEGLTMRFFLPCSVTLANAPEPNDERVKLVPIGEETLAALRYSGTWSEEARKQEERELLAAIEGSRWQASGGPFAQLYDPPFTIPFLRRNEVAVRVAPRS